MIRLPKKVLYVVLSLIAAIVLILILILALKFFGKDPTPIETIDDDTISFDGKEYVLNRNIETFLLIGIDDFAKDVKYDSYINTYQSDFLLLLIIDSTKEEVSAIQINRDAITDVTVLGMQGQRVGKEPMQIALAHTYGTGKTDSALNTVKAVEDLFNISVDHYARITMDAIPVLNDAIGGVTLTPKVSIPDSQIEEGTKLTLNGNQALAYTRARMDVADGTNLSRMDRQHQYMTAFVEKAKKTEDINFSRVLTDINKYTVSDCSIERLQSIYNQIKGCDDLGISTLKGEATVGDEGYVEFNLDKTALQETIVSTFYKEKG